MLATEYLEEGGFKVDIAGSATEALNKLRLIPGGVDAIIVDLGLPDRKGDDLVREVRSIYPSLPIVIASGAGTADMRSRLKDASISYVHKPVSALELCNALRAVGIRC